MNEITKNRGLDFSGYFDGFILQVACASSCKVIVQNLFSSSSSFSSRSFCHLRD